MKKSTNKAIGMGLAGISVLSPIMDTGISVLAVSDVSVKQSKSFDWVKSNHHSSKIELTNETTEGNFWFYDDLSKTLHAKGGTKVKFLVNEEDLQSKVTGIELINGGEVLGESDEEGNLSILLESVPNVRNLEVIYKFEDGSVDRVPFNTYFNTLSGGIAGFKVDNVSPKLTLENKDLSNGVVHEDKYFKGKVEYTFQSDTFDKLLPNIWGTTGYKFKLLINGQDYTDSKAFTLKHDDVTGKVSASLDLDSIYSSLEGECKIDLSVFDNVGNETKYSDTLFVDYTAPSIEGSISNRKWVDKENNVVYFNEGEPVQVDYNVSDAHSGVKRVSLIKNAEVINPKAKSVGSLIIDSEGTYKIKVEDNLGNSKTYALSEIVEGVADTVKFDNSKPVIDVQADGVVNTDWFKNGSSIKIDVKDDIGLGSISYTVNGVKKEVSLSGNPKSHTIDIDSSILKEEDTELNVSISITDVLGKEVNESIKYNADINYPTLDKAEVVGDIVFIDGKACSRNPLVLNGTPKDTGSGIQSVDIFKDGVLVSNTLPFTINEDGVYSIKLTDKVGNVTQLSLEDIVGEEFDGVIIDGSAPSVEASIGGAEVSSDWYKDRATLVINSEDNKNIKTVKYSINGKETVVDVNNKNYSLSLKLEDYVDDKGLVDINYTVVDELGNESNYSKVIKLDKVAPKIENAKLDGNIFMLGNIAFIKDSATLTADIIDAESNIEKVEILNGSEVVGTSLPFKIEKGGIYSVRVTDNVGHVVTKSLKDLLSIDIGDIIIDNDAPVLNATVNGDSIVNSWYKDTAKFNIKATDSSSIEKVEYSINGKTFKEEVNKDNHEISLDLEKYVDDAGKVSITYKATDNLGNESNYEKVISLDTKDPILNKGNLEGKVNIENKIGYINDKLTLSANTEDKESGIAKVEVFRDSKVVATSLPYVIEESGSYEVRVTDGVGHTVTKSLKELTGVDVDSILVDRNKPVITELEGFSPDLIKDGVNWYKSTPSLKMSIQDDNLESISIKVNDKEVIKDISKDGNYSIPIDKSEGTYKISVVATDKSKNTSSDEYTFKVDLNNPSINKGDLRGEYMDREYGLYFRDMPRVSLKGLDSGIGVKEYVLLDKDKNEVNRNTDGVFTLSSGEYFAKTIDFFGNESDVVSIQDLCGLENNRLVIDDVAPVILASRPEGGLDGWFNKNVVYDIQISDNIGINNAFVFINDKLVDTFIAKSDTTSIAFMTDTSKVFNEDGEYTVKVIVEDNTGLAAVWSDTINIDTSAPKFVNGTILDKYVDRGDCLVFPSKPSIKIESNDEGVGLKDIYLVDKDGNKVSNKEGYFELDTNEYSLILEDKLGNKTEATSLQEVCGLPNNKILIDTTKPVINVSRPEGIVGDWFKDDVTYSLNAKDDVGLKKVSVTVNGKEVINSELKENNILDKDYNFSTKGIKPNSDGSYNIVVSTVDIVGNKANWNDTVYIDKSAPVIDKFIITGNGYLEGKKNNSSDKYGFYIKGKTDIEIHVSDGDFSSGVEKLHYELVSSNGEKRKGIADVVNGVAKVSIGQDFKGYISAYAVDRVGNVGSSNRPDGIVSESGNTHVNSSRVDIELPSTPNRDRKGNFLYNKGVVLGSSIVDNYSGLREVKWGINDETKGTAHIDNEGNLSGDTGSVSKKDKNLVVKFDKNLPVSNNENSLNVWVEATDRVGHVSKNNRIISIDKDAPIINVSYSNNNDSSFYNKTRVATVTIKERNFRSGDVRFEGVLGKVGKWTNVEGDTWTCNVEFSEDKDYQWSVSYTDMAGNVGKKYESEKFTVDKTAPVVNVSFNNNNVENGNFYKGSRTATVTVKEKNFNPSSVNLTGSGKLGSWNKNGDVYTSNIVFDKDGKYEFAVDLIDKAGNKSNSFSSGNFIIDLTKPSLNISGVQNGVSYKKNTGFKVNFGDDNIDESRCSVTLTGRSNGKVRLIGGVNGKNGEFTFSGVPDDRKFDDLYTLKAVIYDKAGNREEKTITYSLNRYGSQFSFLNKNLLNNIVSSPKDIVLEEMSVDRLDLKACKLAVIKDGKEIPIDSKYVKVQELGGKDGNWLYRYTINAGAFDTDGKYQVQVYSKALDGTANSSLSQEYSFVLDTAKPEVIVSGVESNNSYNDVSRKVTIEVRDLSGVGSIKALLNGKEVKLDEKEGIYSLEVGESNKKQTLVVEATDKAGNMSTVPVEDFLVTSNVIVSFVNSPLVKGLLGALGAGVIFLLALLMKRRKDRQKEEKELAQEHAKMYHDSITGTSTNSSDDSSKEKK